MSLTSGRGPLAGAAAGRFVPPIAAGSVYVEPFGRRVRGLRGDEVVVDIDAALLVHRPGGAPVWAFPASAVADGLGLEAVAVAEAPGHVEVPWDAVDTWLQEEDVVRLHAPNPYHRVDVVACRRHLRVEVAGAVLVDALVATAVFETALPARLYVPRPDVRMDLLVPSETVTHCPYKGDASHWSFRQGDVVVDDVAWSYEDPLVEAGRIRGLLSFYDARTTLAHDLPAPRPPPEP